MLWGVQRSTFKMIQQLSAMDVQVRARVRARARVKARVRVRVRP